MQLVARARTAFSCTLETSLRYARAYWCAACQSSTAYSSMHPAAGLAAAPAALLRSATATGALQATAALQTALYAARCRALGCTCSMLHFENLIIASAAACPNRPAHSAACILLPGLAAAPTSRLAAPPLHYAILLVDTTGALCNSTGEHEWCRCRRFPKQAVAAA
jgi:hypothetical protein